VGLVDRIGAIIERRGLTQSAAAALLEIDQPRSWLSPEDDWPGSRSIRFVRFLVLLGSDVEIVVKPRARAAGRARVMVARGALEKRASACSIRVSTRAFWRIEHI